MEINYHTVGLRVRRFRLERKITQEELAFQINTSAAYISNIERGRKKPSLQKLAEIADVLGVTLNDLIYSGSSGYSFSNSKELNEMISLCTPEKQQLLLKNLSAIIETFITK